MFNIIIIQLLFDILGIIMVYYFITIMNISKINSLFHIFGGAIIIIGICPFDERMIAFDDEH